MPSDAMRIDEEAIVESFILDVDQETLEKAPRFSKDNRPNMADPALAAAIHRHYKRTS